MVRNGDREEEEIKGRKGRERRNERGGTEAREGRRGRAIIAPEQKSCVLACIQVEIKGVNFGRKDKRLCLQADISQKISFNSSKHP